MELEEKIINLLIEEEYDEELLEGIFSRLAAKVKQGFNDAAEKGAKENELLKQQSILIAARNKRYKQFKNALSYFETKVGELANSEKEKNANETSNEINKLIAALKQIAYDFAISPTKGTIKAKTKSDMASKASTVTESFFNY